MGAADERRGVSFDRIASGYDASRGRYWQAEQTAAAIAPWLTPGEPVVEVRVGTGLIATELLARGWNVVGFDLAFQMLKRAQQRLGLRVGVGDAQHLPVRDASVGSTYLVHVLHLVVDVRATLAEAARILKPGGRVVAICSADGQPTDDAGELLASLRRRLVGPRLDAPERVVSAAQSAGIAVTYRQPLLHEMRMAPADYAATLEDRMWSWTWDVDGDTWAAQVAPVIAELRALPHPNQPRATRHQRTLLAFACR